MILMDLQVDLLECHDELGRYCELERALIGVQGLDV
jgi:hypothetical protein